MDFSLLSLGSVANHDFGGKIGDRRLDFFLLCVGIVPTEYLEDRSLLDTTTDHGEGTRRRRKQRTTSGNCSY